jgi:DNA-directed RNA polymerase specialized sigma24 family protein
MNQESFDRFLEWLDADREEAARKYEAIRRDLITFFDSRVGADAENLADETINTVIEKAPQLIGVYVGDPRHYFFRVALFKRLAYVRTLARRDGGPLPKDMPDARSHDAAMEKEVMSACLRECLQKSRPEEREMLLLYYGESGKGQLKERLELAARLGCSINALRLQIHRLKEKLRVCITECRRREEAR